MIELAHIATGALAGRGARGAVAAAATGVLVHGLMDVAPHGEIHDRQFEVWSTIVGIAALAAGCGPASPLVWGAIGGVLPDAEHVLPSRLRTRRPLFPTHRFGLLHSSDRPLSIPAWAQVVIGGAVIGALAARRRPRTLNDF